MKTLAQISQIMRLAKAYCWQLSIVDRGLSVGINNHMPTPKSKEDDGDSNEKEISRLVDESLKNLESTVKGFDSDQSGRVFSISYSTSKTSHGSGKLGPFEFTLMEPEAQPLGAVQPHVTTAVTNPFGGSLMESIKPLLELSQHMNQAGAQNASSSEALYRQLVVQYNSLIEQVSRERRELRSEHQEREDRLEKEWKERRNELERINKQEIERLKEALEERHALRSESELGRIKDKKRKAKERELEAQRVIDKASNNATVFGNGLFHAVRKAGSYVSGSDGLGGVEEEPAMQQEQQPDPWRDEVQVWAKQVYQSGNPQQLKVTAQLMGLIEDTEIANEINAAIGRVNERRAGRKEGGEDA
jgi:hypothetical protein